MNGKTKLLFFLLVAILVGIAVSGFSQTPSMIMILKTESEAAKEVGNSEIYSYTLDDGSEYLSGLYYDEEGICVSQQSYFTGVKIKWVKNLLINEHGFVKTDSMFIKEVPSGYIAAKVGKVPMDKRYKIKTIYIDFSFYQYEYLTADTIRIKESVDYKEVSAPVLISISDKRKDSEILNSLLKGNWEGTGYQFNIHKSWPMKLIFDDEGNTFKIEYPSLNCSGYWQATSVTNSEIEFTEIITQNRNACVNGGKVVLKLLEENKIEYSFYFPDNRTLDSKGEIKRISL